MGRYVDQCADCPVPYEHWGTEKFTCSDCSCNGCPELHRCCGQCGYDYYDAEAITTPKEIYNKE